MEFGADADRLFVQAGWAEISMEGRREVFVTVFLGRCMSPDRGLRLVSVSFRPGI